MLMVICYQDFRGACYHHIHNIHCIIVYVRCAYVGFVNENFSDRVQYE
jgi:hypothetical protein